MAVGPDDDADLVVLILGSTTTVARALVVYLLGGAQPRASFVRHTDRFSVNPPSTYLDKPYLTILNAEDSKLEYKQVNLANKERHAELFTPPAFTSKKVFDVVFDLTGETSAEKPELIQIQNTYHLALSLATSALSHLPSAYVRLTFPYYDMKPSSPAIESLDLKPEGARGRWWHETLRGMAKLQDKGLKLGVIRCAAPYGPGGWDGEVVARLVVGHVYKHLKEEMKFLHNADLRIHTVHTSDVAASLLLLGRYLRSKSTGEAQAESGVNLSFPFSAPTSSFLGGAKRTSISDSWKTVPTVIPEKEVVKVVLFNIVDDNDSTQEKLAKAVAEVWDVKWGFLNSTVASLVQQFAKTDFPEMVEDVNEKASLRATAQHASRTHRLTRGQHVEAWSAMLAASDPPIASSPITPFLDEHAFKKHAISLDGSRARKVLGFKAAVPTVQMAELQRIVKGFQDDGIWPKTS